MNETPAGQYWALIYKEPNSDEWQVHCVAGEKSDAEHELEEIRNGYDSSIWDGIELQVVRVRVVITQFGNA